jgi:hypothetical protein
VKDGEIVGVGSRTNRPGVITGTGLLFTSRPFKRRALAMTTAKLSAGIETDRRTNQSLSDRVQCATPSVLQAGNTRRMPWFADCSGVTTCSVGREG